MARAVAAAVTLTVDEVAAGSLLRDLAAHVRPDCDTLGRKLDLVHQLLQRESGPQEVAATLGNDVAAAGSVPAALYSVLAHPTSFRDAVVYAVSLGGDMDTIGAMAGAIAGALHGEESIPREWLEALENGEKGRDYVRLLATQLWELSTSAEGQPG